MLRILPLLNLPLLNLPLLSLPLLSWLACGAVVSVAQAEESLPPPADREVSYENDIAPLLRQRCYSCHGPEEQESGLRLDVGRRALEGGDSGRAIVPGRSQDSPLIARVAGLEPDLIMPPEGEGTPLTAAEVGLLRAWIDQGARFPQDEASPAAEHWSFQPVRRPQPPMQVSDPHWVRNPIDAFVLVRLDEAQIEPAPEADRATLMRRVYLDLLGLPPTPQQLRDFLEDDDPLAYEHLVDRLLQSEHYGERWGRHWLDLARYADSDGYEKDRPRPHAWRYRQWVIKALNADMPFDQFTVEQIAGDMLPDAELGQRIATGFHRNTLHNTEGGIDPEEDRVKKTVDRVNTIGAVWMGLTLGCAQCHSHKYDPITQREYYQMFAFVNNIDEQDIDAPTPQEARQLAQAREKHQAQLAELTAARDAYVQDQLAAEQTKWERQSAGQAGWETVLPSQPSSKHGAEFQQQPDQSLLVSGPNKLSDVYTLNVTLPIDTACLRLEVLPDDKLPKGGPGRADNGNFVLTTVQVRPQPVGEQSGQQSDGQQPATIASARADFAQKDWAVELSINDNAKDGWAVSPQMGKRHVAVFALQQPLAAGSQVQVVLHQHYEGGSPHNLGRFRLSVSSDPAAPLDGIPQSVAAALQVAAGERTAEQQQSIDEYYKSIDPQLAKLKGQLADHQAKAPKGPTNKAQAVVERAEPRQSRILLRGDFLNPGEPVEARGLQVLPPIEPRSGQAVDRLDLARWLVDDHPLTGRVVVNRIWQRYFGRGLVVSSDDFGDQGAPPTHPLLLDWLASELQDNGWRLKHIHRLITTSSAYRQSSDLRPELQERDPQNELLARYPRSRVEAEIVRDLALAVSGLLDPRIGGPSVRPPQPPEHSDLTYANSAKWNVSSGGDRYRRGLYTFFQRTSPYPMLMTFDSPDSNECTARRSESNTPLQALTLWNDPVFFECCQQLARRIVSEAPRGSDPAATARLRASYAMQLCLSRDGSPEEIETLAELRRAQLQLWQQDEKSDEAVAKIIGSRPVPDDVEPAELASWVLLGRVLINLDEFITIQ